MTLEFPSLTTGPGFWLHEESGLLKPVVYAYLQGEPLTLEQVAILRLYLTQWMVRGDWRGHGIEALRTTVRQITTRADLDRWVHEAAESDIDPF